MLFVPIGTDYRDAFSCIDLMLRRKKKTQINKNKQRNVKTIQEKKNDHK